MSKCVTVLEGKVVLYQRPRSKVWQTRVKLDDGKWHRTTTNKNDENEAKERALEIYYETKARAENKLPQTSRRFSNVAKMATQIMDDELESGRGKVVYRAYKSALKNVLTPFFGAYNIDNITPKLLTEFEQWRRDKAGKEIPASTITDHNSALNRVFELAIQHGWATRNALPKLINKGKKAEPGTTFSIAEYRLLHRRMREWCKYGTHKRSKMMRILLRDYVLILANTGMRHGTEADNLKWKDIDWFVNTDKKTYLQMTVDGKTGNRQLIARHNCVHFLNRIKNRFDDLKELTLDEIFKARIDEYVFRLSDGSRTKNLHQTFEKMLTDIDLLYGTTSNKPRTLYSMRHFYATQQLLHGRNIHQLAVQMGTSVAMLETHYSKLTPLLLADKFAGHRHDATVLWD